MVRTGAYPCLTGRAQSSCAMVAGSRCGSCFGGGGYVATSRPIVEAAVGGTRRSVGLPATALIACFFLASVDLSGLLSLGPISMSGMSTIVVPGLLAMALLIDYVYASALGTRFPLSRAYQIHQARVPGLLWLFVAYALMRLAMSPTVEAVQNVLCYTLFVTSVSLVATALRRDYSRVLSAMIVSGCLGAVFFVAQTLSGSPAWMGARSFAMTGIVTLCMVVAAPTRAPSDEPTASVSEPVRARSSSGLLAVLLASLLVTAVTISLSRTAFAVAFLLLLFMVTRVRAGRRLRVLGALTAAIIVMVVLVSLFYPPFLERFTVGDNAKVGSIAVNTSGRAQFWEITWDSAMRAPIWGHGPGTAGRMIEAHFGHTGIGHPHNDYLRVFNDLGVIGVVLFWGGIFYLLGRCIRRAVSLGRREDWAATAALLVVVLMAVTDNIIVYGFVMMPVGVLAGMCLRDDVRAYPSLVSSSPAFHGGVSRWTARSTHR